MLGSRGSLSTGVARVIYGLVLFVGFLADAVLLVWLFVSGHAGWGVLFLVAGTWVIPSIAHLVGLMLAMPFALAGEIRSSGLRESDGEFLVSPIALQWQHDAREQDARERQGTARPGEPSFRRFDDWRAFRGSEQAETEEAQSDWPDFGTG